jgi:hypothetical protein
MTDLEILAPSARAILRDAAGRLLAFDPELAAHLNDLAADYAGPLHRGDRMSAAHNHAPVCCCGFIRCTCPTDADVTPDMRDETGQHLQGCGECPACPEHGQFATPYTEQETTK